jgi:hypothetical protein
MRGYLMVVLWPLLGLVVAVAGCAASQPPSTAPAAGSQPATRPAPPGVPAWSPTVNGLRTRLSGPQWAVPVGETFELRMLIQNVSDKPISIRPPSFLSVIRDPKLHPGSRTEAKWNGSVITTTWPHRLEALFDWHADTSSTMLTQAVLQPQATYTVLITVRGSGQDREVAEESPQGGPQRERVSFLYDRRAGKYPLTATYSVPLGTANVWCGTLVAPPVDVELVPAPAQAPG